MNRLNIADEILEVLGMVNELPFVQTVIHNKDQVPNGICCTTEQLPSTHGQMGPIWAESGHDAQIGPTWVPYRNFSPYGTHIGPL